MSDAFDAIRRPNSGRSDSGPAARPGGSWAPASRGPANHEPARHEIDALIAKAKGHALGVDFLLRGAHDAVAVTFGVHAFVVDAAREHLVAGGAAIPAE